MKIQIINGTDAKVVQHALYWLQRYVDENGMATFEQNDEPEALLLIGSEAGAGGFTYGGRVPEMQLRTEPYNGWSEEWIWWPEHPNAWCGYVGTQDEGVEADMEPAPTQEPNAYEQVL